MSYSSIPAHFVCADLRLFFPRALLARIGGGLCMVVLGLLLVGAARAEKLEQLKPQGYVNDFAGVLDARVRQQITALCAEVDQKAHAQIAVVTIRSLDGVPVSDFANRLYKQWGVGYKAENRGVLVLLAVGDRKYWTEVGYGLEPILPDGKVGGFGREIIPLLRRSDYGGALLHLTSRVAEAIASDRGVGLGSRPLQRRQQRHEGFPAQLIALLVFLFLALLWNGLSLFGMGRRGRYRSRGGWWLIGGPGIGGGSWGGGGFGGGGFGGFGGGASGGGGAGGSW